MGRPILLNIDAGELPNEPDALYAIADVLNVACGGHAGDDASMDRVIRAAKANGRSVGAHPSYEDRDGFGRREIDVTPGALSAQIHAQCTHLADRAKFLGVRVGYVKLHGALYHAANKDTAVAEAVIEGATQSLGNDIAWIAAARGKMAEVAHARGLRVLVEGFADRGVRPDGSLVPRGEPGALVVDPEVAAENAVALAMDVDTVCVHGDTPGALEIARAVRKALDGIVRPTTMPPGKDTGTTR